jgi:hypothetical protein
MKRVPPQRNDRPQTPSRKSSKEKDTRGEYNASDYSMNNLFQPLEIMLSQYQFGSQPPGNQREYP